MRKVLIAPKVFGLLRQEPSLLDRSDLQVHVAPAGDESVALHRAVRMDLVIAELGPAGGDRCRFCALIREDASSGSVPIILTCDGTPEALRASSHCGADVVMTEPLQPVLLTAKIRQYLGIPSRESIRVTLNTDVDARAGSSSFTCRARNVSVTGMLIETERQLVQGALLACRFYLPVARQIEAAGRIVRIIERPQGGERRQYGLMFTSLTGDNERLLREYVAEGAWTGSEDRT